MDTFLGENNTNYTLIDAFVERQYKLMKNGYNEYKAFELIEKELTENLTSVFFTDKEVSFRTVDIYSILDRAFTKINDETNSLYPIEVLLKLIYEKLYKNKNQGKNYLKNEKKEKNQGVEAIKNAQKKYIGK